MNLLNNHRPLLMFLVFFTTTSLFSESYSSHRLDDKNYLFGGRKNLYNEGRIESVLPQKYLTSEKPMYETESFSDISIKQYLSPKFYSQKGGDKEDLARRYATQVSYSPELVGFKKAGNTKYMLLISPILSYREDFQLKRNVIRPADGEFITAWKLDENHFSLNLEGGRGFQRLDAYGVLFSGITNYAETNFYWKPLDIKFSLLGLSYNYLQENFTIRANNINNKLIGGNLLFQSIPWINRLQIFNYQILEPGQIAEKEYLQEDRPFKPKGKFSYRGFELKTKDFFAKINSELGVFSVTGYRDYAEYSYQAYNNINKTNGFLSYLVLNFLFEKLDFRTGGLYATKDKSTSLNRAHNGYSSLLSDVRIFGGKSSFLLMETVNQKNGTLFREFDSTKENRYDTKGMELVSLGISYNISQNLQLSGILNHVSSGIGIGNEGILSAIYHLTSSNWGSGFLLTSICLARVNPVTQKKILYDEFRVDPDIKEFTRFYISGGFYF